MRTDFITKTTYTPSVFGSVQFNKEEKQVGRKGWTSITTSSGWQPKNLNQFSALIGKTRKGYETNKVECKKLYKANGNKVTKVRVYSKKPIDLFTNKVKVVKTRYVNGVMVKQKRRKMTVNSFTNIPLSKGKWKTTASTKACAPIVFVRRTPVVHVTQGPAVYVSQRPTFVARPHNPVLETAKIAHHAAQAIHHTVCAVGEVVKPVKVKKVKPVVIKPVKVRTVKVKPEKLKIRNPFTGKTVVKSKHSVGKQGNKVKVKVGGGKAMKFGGGKAVKVRTSRR